MDDVISRQAAIDAVNDLPNCYNGYSDAYDKSCIIGVLEELPPAQPEIIRCKDCKHLYEDNGCPLRTWWTHTEDDFCSYAERRSDD